MSGKCSISALKAMKTRFTRVLMSRRQYLMKDQKVIWIYRGRSYKMRLLTYILLLICFQVNGANDSLNTNRLKWVVITESALAAGSISILATTWYQSDQTTGFHWFNDNREWLQVDKIGHFQTSFFLGTIGIDALRWSGVENKKAIYYGGFLGFGYLSIIELMDGFQPNYGCSPGDITANFLGSAALIAQELTWGERKILFKFSYSPSDFAKYRPEVLGETAMERILKDYNGQTYWASIGLHQFFPNWQKRRFLSISLGYGATGMTGGHHNVNINDLGDPVPAFDRHRQFFLSLDMDLTKIKTRSDFLRTMFRGINFIKIPFPALEYNTNGSWQLHPLYY